MTTAKSLGFNSLALTDHGNLGNAVAFSAACEHNDVRPIIGVEAYVGRDGKRYHLTLLADGNEGFSTLVELNNAGQRSDDPTRPTFPLELLRKHHKGLVVLTGCPASPLQDNEWSDAYQIGLELKSFLGPRLMAEFMFISVNAPWERAAKLATDLKLIPVVTNDVHFALPEDAPAHHAVTQLRSGYAYDGEQLFLATPAQLHSRIAGLAPGYDGWLDKGMRNAHRLAARLGVVKFDDTPKLPHIPNANEQLRKQARAGLENYFTNKSFSGENITDQGVYIDRLEDELNVICDMGFATYFIILTDIINFARGSGVRVGPGRGSGAGSLVLFSLGGTEIDPIQYGLSFDRFLNRNRAEMPDVDTDFESERRDQVLTYAKQKWGAIGVATYSRYSHKSLTHALSRYFHVPRDMDEAAADGGTESAEFATVVNKFPQFKQVYDVMEGQISNLGQHAGGVVIVDDEFPIPLTRTVHGGLVAAWAEGEYRELSRAGVVKFDLLGLSALSVLRRLEEKNGRHAALPVDDDPVFSIFRDGDLTGIFQFSGSQGIHDFTVKVAPHVFEDLVAINALYRPGALDSGAAQNYPEWRQRPRLIHPFIDDILAPTYGVICYQEQFMAIFARLTGGTMADADLARKVLSKARPGQAEWEAKMAQLKVEFFDGITRSKLPDTVGHTLWDEIVTHTRYSFNRSHSVAYAMVAWELAWWKYHHTTDFYAAMLSVDKDEWQRYLFDVIARGIKVVPPHVNTSTDEFVSDGKQIYLPITIVKHLGGKGVEAILKNRPFTSLDDFAKRVAPKAVSSRPRTGLMGLGAFDGLPGTWKELGLKEEPPTLTAAEAQELYMGITLPTQEFLTAVTEAEARGMKAGMVSAKETRPSTWGDYIVYTLLPAGRYWARGLAELELGDHVALKVASKTGKITKVYPLGA